MSRMLLSPGRYIQGAGAMNEIGSYAANMGSKALVTGGKRALAFCGATIQTSLEENKIGCKIQPNKKRKTRKIKVTVEKWIFRLRTRRLNQTAFNHQKGNKHECLNL